MDFTRIDHFNYETCCVHSTAELIEDMIEQETEITWGEFATKVSQELIDEVFPTYKEVVGLSLGTDYHVRFFHSYYDGKPCVFVVHSAIEYIFTEQQN